MIGSALRAEIQMFYSTASDGRLDREVLARCAAASAKLTRGVRVPAAEEALPSLSSLAALVESSATEQPASYLAFRALGEYVAAQLGVADGQLDRAEASLDTIDDIALDPAELPRIREQLRRYITLFQQLYQEAHRALRRQPALHVSAA